MKTKQLLIVACVAGVLLGCRWHWFYLPVFFGPMPVLPVPLPISSAEFQVAAAQFGLWLCRLL